MRKQTAVWTTKAGERLRICDMDDRHLLNAISLIERRYKDECLNAANAADSYSAGAPDAASDAAHSEAVYLFEAVETLEGLDEACPLYPKLLAEQGRRHRLYRESVKEE
jgi:hypothetical protein